MKNTFFNTGFMALLTVFIFLTGCGTKIPLSEEPVGIPQPVLEKYEEMKIKFAESVGAFLFRCTKEVVPFQEVVYEVEGSGGYSGIIYYYDEQGILLGESGWMDVPDFCDLVTGVCYEGSEPPPIDMSDYNCTELRGAHYGLQSAS